MKQVDFIDYGLGWETLKFGEEGDTVCFEITTFEASCPEEVLRVHEEMAEEDRRRNMSIARQRAKAQMRKRLKRMIMGNNYRQYYWLPSFVLGRSLLSILSYFGLKPLTDFSLLLGVEAFSLSMAYCLPYSEQF
jgi:hypothetical protein